MSQRRKLALALLVLIPLVFLGGQVVVRYMRAASVLLGLVGEHTADRLLATVRSDVQESTYQLELGGRTTRTRRYAPAGWDAPPVLLLLHGVHPRGIDEPRLRALARSYSSVGLDVHTPELPELLAYRVEPRTIDDIGRCAEALATNAGRPIGAFGVSFAGGLLLMAAAQDRNQAFDYTVVAGAHHDLRRLARYYAGRPVLGPGGERVAPRADPYGARVIIRAHAERFFSGSDLPLARDALGLYLAEHYTQARALIAKLSPQGRARAELIIDDDRFDRLGALLMSEVERGALQMSATSPDGRLDQLRTPGFLIHGLDDPIIPSIETRWLAREVPARALRQALITPVLRHAEAADEPSIGEHLRVVHFVAEILREARTP